MSFRSELICESIPFVVVHASSEHLEHPGKCLETKDVDTLSSLGWQSEAHCVFPQHIIIKLLYPPHFPASNVSLTQLKVLTHESKIPKRVEIFLSKVPFSALNGSIEDKGWKDDVSSFYRLGYVSFDCNQRSKFRARELKSIKLGGARNISFIKLDLHECHSNAFNQDSQVGIVDITIVGELCPSIPGENSNSRIINYHGSMTYPEDIQRGNKDQKENNAHSSSTEYRERKNRGMGHTKRLELLSKENERVETVVKKRVEELERLKHMKAVIEDYDGAAKVKEVLMQMRSMQESFQTIQQEMYQAAKEEDFIRASQLKDHRNQVREALLEALEDEGDFGSDYSLTTGSHSMEDISLSTMSIEEPPQSSSTACITIDRSDAEKDVRRNDFGSDTKSYPSGSPETNVNYKGEKSCTNNIDTNSEDGSTQIKAAREHPLYGIPGHEDLPLPEEVSFEDGHVSPDALQKVESLIGTYLAKCFFSRHWSLREAAIQKTSIILPSLRNQMTTEQIYRGLLVVTERALEDRIVQVVLTALVFVDNVITEFEKGGMMPRESVSLLTPIIINLIGKLGDSKPKVVDTAEKALMSFALSTCIGPSHIAQTLVRTTNLKDMKGGKSLVTRFVLLRQLMDGFDLQEGPSTERLLEFIRDCGMNHKESEVRDAAKDLAVAIYIRDGDVIDVLSILEGLSDRQVKEYKTAFAMAKKSRGSRVAYMRNQKQLEKRVNMEEAGRSEALDRPSMPRYIADENATIETSVVRGRGRGRGRMCTSRLQPQYLQDDPQMIGPGSSKNNESLACSRIPSYNDDDSY